ncbi:MAG: hypothetical protein OXI24_14620, partial [Candidatus Poribacteria bacterium]|nr:hypothetical protein [Candidatus Poribacteria bacterium]
MNTESSIGTIPPHEGTQEDRSEVTQRLTESDVQEDLLRQPQLMMKTLLVAENLRDNHFRNTAHFIRDLRRAIDEANKGIRDTSILQTYSVKDASWEEFQNELVSFIDGGIGRTELSQAPI